MVVRSQFKAKQTSLFHHGGERERTDNHDTIVTFMKLTTLGVELLEVKLLGNVFQKNRNPGVTIRAESERLY